MTNGRAARLRAARAYAGMTGKELAQMLGVSLETLSRLENDRGREIRHDELEAVASITNVPLSFLLYGFSGLEDQADRIRRMEAQLAEDAVRLGQLEAAVRELAATGRHRPPAEGGGR